MKTPREILLERHQAAAPELDAIRQSAVAAVCDRRLEINDAHERRSQTAATMILKTFWRELILPSRRIWAGLAAVWLVLAAVNLSQRDHSPAGAMKSAPTPDLILTFRQQERLLTELIGPDEARSVAPATPFLPQPRGERRLEILTT
jgi:hypothetical protein